MSISLQCHNCEKVFKLPDEIAGRKIRCKNCDEILRVPELDAVDYAEEIGDWDFKSYNRDDKADFRESDFKRRSRARNASGKSKKGRVAIDKGRKKAHPLVFWGSIGCGVVMVFALLIGFIVWKVADAVNQGMEEVAKAAEEARIEQQEMFDEMVLEPINLSKQGLPLVIDAPDDIHTTRVDGTVYLNNDFFHLNIQRPGPKDTIQEKVKDINLSNQEMGDFGVEMTYEKLDENALRIASPQLFDDGEKGYTIYAIVDVGNTKYLCQTGYGLMGSYTKEQSDVMLKCIRSLRSAGSDPPAGKKEQPAKQQDAVEKQPSVDEQETKPKQTSTLEAGNFSVELTEVAPDKKISVIRAVRSLTNKSLKDSKTLVETAPRTLVKKISQQEAEKIKQQVEAAGGSCVIKDE